MDTVASNRRRLSWSVIFLAAIAPALAAVLWGFSVGVSPHRLWPVAAFLMVWVSGASTVVIVENASRLRALRLRSVSVPLGVRLGTPVWISLREVAGVVAVGAAFATVAAAFGFPGVGVGIQLVLGALSVPLILPIYTVSALTFESAGLRVHGRRSAQFVVPWTSVIEVGFSGTADNQSTSVQIVDPGRVIASVSPDSPRNRFSVELLFELGNPRGRGLHLGDWTAGLDAPTLVRAIRERMHGRVEQTN